MAQERIYQSQVGTPQPVNLPGAGPASFGAEIGGALDSLGGSLARADELDRRNRADSEAADFNRRFSELRAAADTASVDARNGAAPGGAGHAAKMADWWKAQTAGLTDAISDSRVRRQAETQIADFGGRLGASEYAWSEGQRVKKVVTDQGEATAIAANRARRNQDGEAYKQELALGRQAIAALNAPEDVKEALIREHEGAVTVGFFNGVIEKAPQAVGPLLDSGQFDSLLSPEQQEHLRRGAAIGIERQQVAVDRIERERIKTEKADEQVALGDVGRGVAVDPSLLETYAARAEQRGERERAAELRAAAVGGRVNSVYGNGNADAGQMTNRLVEIESDPDWRRKPAKVAEHTQIERLRTERRNAMPEMGELNLDDPAAIARRSAESRSWAERNEGRRYIFNREQATTLTNLAQSGPQGRAQVAEALSRLPGNDAMVGLWQVARGDQTLRAAIDLPPALRGEVFRGEALAKQNPQLVSTRDLNETWGERIQPALDGLPVERQADIKAAATALYAADARPGEWDADAFVARVNRALSPNGGGGIGSHRGRPIVLPNGMSQRELDRRWAGMADNISAIDGSGRRLGRPLVQSQYRMVPTGRDGFYYLADPRGNFALSPKGGRYALNVRRMGNAAPPAAAAAPRSPVRGGAPVFVAPPARPLGVAVPVYRAPPVR